MVPLLYINATGNAEKQCVWAILRKHISHLAWPAARLKSRQLRSQTLFSEHLSRWHISDEARHQELYMFFYWT
jgi:hypothetical protein